MDSLFNCRVLITGGAGFTGKHLITKLQGLGAKVKVLTKEESLLNDSALPKLTEAISQYNPEYVFHLAAISFVGHKKKSDFYDVNVIGTDCLLSALCDANLAHLKKVIIVSSANVYGNKESNSINEAEICEPVNHYAISKVAAEAIAKTYFDDLPIIITRPFNYTGMGQSDSFIIPKLVKSFQRKDAQIEVGNIETKRDFSSVDFVVNAYIKLILSPFDSEIVNICSGKTYKISKIIEMLSELSGHHPVILINPAFIRKNEIMDIGGDNKKLISMIGQLKIDTLDETVMHMYKGLSK